MKKRLSVLAYFLSGFGGYLFGFFIYLSDYLFPETDDVEQLPFWILAIIFLGFFISLGGIIMSFFTRNRELVNKYEIPLDIIFFIVGVAGMLFALLRGEHTASDDFSFPQFLRKIFVACGVIFFLSSIPASISTAIGLLRKPSRD